METSKTLDHSLARALVASVRTWTLPGLIVLFVLADGIVTRNPEPFAAPWRAGLLVVMFTGGLAALAVSHRGRVELGAALCAGILCAMLVSQAYHHHAQPGLEMWVVFGLVYTWQRAVKREWRADFRRAGLLLAVLCLWLWLGITINGLHRPPVGMWNTNVIGGVLAALIPSVLDGTKGVKRWVTLAAMIAAIVVLESRGGLLAAMCAILIMGKAWLKAIPRPAIIVLSACILVASLIVFVMDPRSNLGHTEIMKAAAKRFVSSPLFGIGPGPISIQWLHYFYVQAHNTLVNLVVMTGVFGAVMIGMALALVRRARLETWQWATLGALGVQGLVDDPFTWLPTIIICALVLGGTHGKITET